MRGRETNELGRGREEERGKGRGDKEGGVWNVAGLKRKDEGFWRGLEEWDVMVLSETWVEEKDWGYVERSLPRVYTWEKQWAMRESRKGRAMEGMLLGVRNELEVGDWGGGRRDNG